MMPSFKCNKGLTAMVLANLIILTALVHPVHAFTVPQPRQLLPSALIQRNVVTSDFGTAMPETVSIYEQLGVEEDQVALGVNPVDILNYLGTRDDLIQRTMNDIKDFDRSKAEAEVDKFLLDQEALTMMIQFMKKKEEDPDFNVPAEASDDEGFFSVRTLFIAYAVYFTYTTGSTLLKQWVAGQQQAGKWDGTGIPFIDEWLTASPPSPEVLVSAMDFPAAAVVHPALGSTLSSLVDSSATTTPVQVLVTGPLHTLAETMQLVSIVIAHASGGAL